jgi:hypothetical protein
METIVKNFENELRTIYADNKPPRRAHILETVARLRAKYNQKLVALRASIPARTVDDAEQAITKVENKYAAQLAA